jgi:NAD+ synthase (glutamine-hydrolysing)
LCFNERILLIRPKTALADNGNYRESRYFTAYNNNSDTIMEEYLLPIQFQERFNQHKVPFGTHFLTFLDGTTIGCESCEELWTPQSTHINLSLKGVEIIGNGSGSHFELRKLQTRLELMVSATRKCGGIYLYANQRGCDGGRCYYDGSAMIVCNGQVLAQASQFSVQEVQVITATVDLETVRSYRASLPSFGIQAAKMTSGCGNNYIDVPVQVALGNTMKVPTAARTEIFHHSPQEECCLGPACWLWDYLRRSGAAGFFLPLSGGADSSSVATIVGVMCTVS